MKPVIAIIFGGVTAEHQLSLLSAMHVIENINHAVYDVLQIGVDTDGTMYAGPHVLMTLKHDLSRHELAKCTISTSGDLKGVFILPTGKANVFQKIDLFFPLIHGPYGEDGTLQGIFEYSHVPYVGSGVLGSALGMDKIVMKKLFATYRLAQVPFLPFTKEEIQTDILTVRETITQDLRFPLFVKPANFGSSIGIKKVSNIGKLEDALEFACTYSDRIIVEQGLTNARELECAVIGTNHLETSNVGEVTSRGEFYDGAAQYHSDQTQVIIPAPLDHQTTAEIKSMALKAFKIMHLRGLAKIDFFLINEQILINEVNTLPSFTANGMLCKLFGSAGIDTKQLIQKLIDISLAV